MNFMKFSSVVILLTLLTFGAMAQSKMPSVALKTLNGESVDITDYTNKGKITVVSFWATWCKPCQKELEAVSEVYPDWVEDYDMQLVAVTIDTRRQLAKVAPLVESKGWEFDILSDANQGMRNALNFQSIPYTILLDQNGNIVYEHSGYLPGDEYELEEKIKELAGKK